MSHNRLHNHLEEVNMIGKLADLKEEHYHNTLLLSAMVELLVDKGLITATELQTKLIQLDHSAMASSLPNDPTL